MRSIFDDLAQQISQSPYGLLGGPQMIFISAIEEGFLVGGSAQYLGTVIKKTRTALGRSWVDRKDTAFNKARTRSFKSMEGAQDLIDLRTGISGSLIGKDFASTEDLNDQVVKPANEATQKRSGSTDVNRHGQAFSSSPLWKRRDPCAKCRVIHQFSSSLLSNTQPLLRACGALCCAEDAWELKHRLIRTYTASQASNSIGQAG